MTNRPQNPPVIGQSDMRPGDVILSRGSAEGVSLDALLDQLILALDQGDYTHASLWDGKYVIEALTTGVAIDDPLEMTLKNQVLIDVYRYKKNNETFGPDGYPVEPLLNAARAFKGYGYNYTTLVLSAMLLFTCEVPDSKWVRVALKLLEIPILDKLDKFLSQENAMVCSQVVAQAYWDTPTSPANARGLPIVLDGHRHFPSRGEQQSTLKSMATADISDELQQYHKLRADLADLFEKHLPPTAPTTQALVAGGPEVTLTAGSPQLPAMFVTPGDLQRCGDLELVGTIPSQHTGG